MNPAKNNAAEDVSAREIVITRIVNAPRDLVFRVMSTPEHVVKWWGPNGFSDKIGKMDFRVGGTWEHVMKGPDGSDYPNKSTFTEIVPNERICYSHTGGKAGTPEDEMICKSFTWTFTDVGNGQTRITMRMLMDTAAAKNKMVEFGVLQGGEQTLSRLSDYLIGQQGKPFVISRVLKAPRPLVFKVWTEKEHVTKWFGPKGFDMVTGDFDLRPGGTFHYCMKTPQGQEMWGKAYYRDVVQDERVVWITTFSDKDGNITRHPFAPDWPREMLTIATFEDHPEGTTVTIRWNPLNATEAEQKVFDTSHEGMHGGWSGTFEQLETYLAQL